MTNRLVGGLRDWVTDDTTEPEVALVSVRFPIEEGQILQFARALGDPNPVYADAAYSRGLGFGDVLAPPTFAIALNIFDPDFPGRPRPGRPWPPAGRGADQPGDTFHAEQHFEYRRHPVAGEVLYASSRPGCCWTRDGRSGGSLEFRETITDLADAAGKLVISSRFVTVTTAVPVSPDARADPPADIPADGTMLVENLLRTQIVMYCAASGDYHPLHHDEQLAREVGLPAISPHGMFLMGVAARMITDRFGDGMLATYSARFLRTVWPGDTIIGQLTVLEGGPAADPTVAGGQATRLRVELVTDKGKVVMRGSAIVAR
jgi:acyl dehydratase